MKKNDPSHFVTEVDPSVGKKMLEDLTEQGFEISHPAYTVFNAKKKGIVCTLYLSGKLVVQGAEMTSFIEFYLEPEILKAFVFNYEELQIDVTARIGVDEAGKGDFFGPLCVAAVFAEGEGILKLKEIGVKDSKGLSDAKIIEIGKKIEASFAYHIVKINPAKYNEIYPKFKNLNRLLAWGHATAIEKLSEQTGCRHVIVDQFANENVVKRALEHKEVSVDLIQRHYAEEDLVVAAASILARKTFVEGIASLSKEFDMTFPKGASAQVIKAGKQFLKRYGLELMEKVGKMHFKTLDSITGANEDTV